MDTAHDEGDELCPCGTWTRKNVPSWHTCAKWNERVFETPLDPGIARAVHLLMDNGVETYESCQGGDGHSYPYPAVRFDGQQYEGFRALGVARMYDLPVRALRRAWTIQDGEPTGPFWELEFRTQLPPVEFS